MTRILKEFYIKLLIIILLYGNALINAQILLNDTIKIQEAIISANRVEVVRKNVSLTVSSLNENEIEEDNESAILSTISHKVPGVFVTQKGITGFGVGSKSSGQVSIRGIGGSAPNSQILVLIDGHPQYMGIFGHPIPDAYVSSDIKKVEVVRGPASFLYGSNAMGGIINIVTKHQQTNGYSVSGRVGYGSFNTQKYMINSGYKKNSFDIFASVNHDHTNGHRDSSSFKITNGFIKAGYKINKSLKISADLNIADFVFTDPGSTYDTSIAKSFMSDITRGKASISVRNNFRKIEGAIISYYNFGMHDLSDGWYSTDANKGLVFYQAMKLFKGNKFSFGIDYKDFGGEGNGGMDANKWNSITEFAGYVCMLQTFHNKFAMNGGLRLENNNKYGNKMVPQIGLSYYTSENTTLKLSVSKGFRSPTVMETYLFYPNPKLKPEELINYDISFLSDFMNNKLRVELTAYYITGKNFIQLIPNPEGPPPLKRVNSGEFKHKGIELVASYKVNQNLDFNSNYSYLNMSSAKLAAPEHQLFIESNYTNKKFRMTFSLEYISGLYSSLGTSEAKAEIEDYVLANCKMMYKFHKSFDFFISGKNLLNTTYQIYKGYPMPKFNIMAGINMKFKKE